jgi:hypothetical protein
LHDKPHVYRACFEYLVTQRKEFGRDKSTMQVLAAKANADTPGYNAAALVLPQLRAQNYSDVYK